MRGDGTQRNATEEDGLLGTSSITESWLSPGDGSQISEEILRAVMLHDYCLLMVPAVRYVSTDCHRSQAAQLTILPEKQFLSSPLLGYSRVSGAGSDGYHSATIYTTSFENSLINYDLFVSSAQVSLNPYPVEPPDKSECCSSCFQSSRLKLCCLELERSLGYQELVNWEAWKEPVEKHCSDGQCIRARSTVGWHCLARFSSADSMCFVTAIS